MTTTTVGRPVTEPMADTIGLVYDCDAAAHFVQTTTGIAEDTVRRVMAARDRYHLGLSILPAEAVEDETPDEIRASQSDLFPADHIARRFLSPPLEREFIVRTTDIGPLDVLAIQVADEEYMRRQGIVGCETRR
jgi:hypothetical protein